MVNTKMLQRRPSVGDIVTSPTNDQSGTVLVDDNSDLPYKVLFDNGVTDWCKVEGVHHKGARPETPPAISQKVSISSPASVELEDARSIEAFFRRNPYFIVPWLILWPALYSMRYIPPLQAYFETQGMQLFGFIEAAKLTVWCIVFAFALHGFIAANHDELVAKGLKIVSDMPYNWKSGDSSVRSSFIYLVGMMTYALVPMRMAPAETWGATMREFIVGYAILLVAGDAHFFCCHYLFHTKTFYKACHKTHHTWKYPVSFAAYYIASHTHMIQEHLCTIPLMLLCPIPCSSFMFYQYYGVPGAQIQHTGFSLEKMHLPFCGPIRLGHLMNVCGFGLNFILGSQSTSMHDYHHEKFHGNFQLSYSYLDHLFGTYVDTEKDAGSLEYGLLKV